MPHSYYDYGTDTVIGTHNYTTRPSTWSGANVQTDRTRYYGWPKGGTRAVLLPESMWSDIQDGTATGIAVGPGVTNDIYYYSYYNGADPDYTPSSRPYLKVTYSK
jgi:hypothetical protein